MRWNGSIPGRGTGLGKGGRRQESTGGQFVGKSHGREGLTAHRLFVFLPVPTPPLPRVPSCISEDSSLYLHFLFSFLKNVFILIVE